jgi:hypothetical protein
VLAADRFDRTAARRRHGGTSTLKINEMEVRARVIALAE